MWIWIRSGKGNWKKMEGLFEEGDKETILKMDFDQAVPLLMLMLGIGEDEAFEIWKQHQWSVSLEPDVLIGPMFLEAMRVIFAAETGDSMESEGG
jgi:hypothetical protein